MEHYFEYKGKRYGVGTRVRLRGIYSWETTEKVFQKRTGDMLTFVNDRGNGESFFANKAENHILDIIEESQDVVCETQTQQKCPPSWNVEIGWVWYIIIMVVGAIFKDRWLIWIAATAFFFAWKNGLLKKKE